MGHLFGLAHPNAGNICEHAERIPGNPFYNADVSGDYVSDTHVEVSPTYIDSNCNYLGGGLDCINENVYTQLVDGFLIKPGYNNFMYASGSTSCLPIFTPGQGRRMREAIIGYWADSYQEKMNTIQSLYEPFERTKIIGNVKSIVDNNDGTATVCRFYTESFRFQKGFNYTFPNNIAPDGTNFVPNDIPEILNPPFNCPIIIEQLGLINNEYPIGNALTIDKGFICETEEWVKGLVVTTPVLGSYTFTIEEWNKLKASDPNFYQYLENNKYHIIKRETEKGVVLEVVLFKI